MCKSGQDFLLVKAGKTKGEYSYFESMGCNNETYLEQIEKTFLITSVASSINIYDLRTKKNITNFPFENNYQDFHDWSFNVLNDSIVTFIIEKNNLNGSYSVNNNFEDEKDLFKEIKLVKELNKKDSLAFKEYYDQEMDEWFYWEKPNYWCYANTIHYNIITNKTVSKSDTIVKSSY